MPIGDDYLASMYPGGTDGDPGPVSPSSYTLRSETWHSVAQSSDAASADVNQQFGVHESVAAYSDGTLSEFDVATVNGKLQTFGGPFGSSASTGWIQLDGVNVSGIAQALDGTTLFSGTRLRIPISAAQLTTNMLSPMKEFSSACDISVSFQGSLTVGSTHIPDGAKSYELVIPKEIINALQSSQWSDANELIPSEFFSISGTMAPNTILTTTTTASYTLTATFAGSINVANNTGFPTAGGSFIISSGSNSVTLSYAGVDSSNNLLDCVVKFGDVADPGGTTYPAGSSVLITAGPTSQYVSAGDFIVLVNALSSGSTSDATAAAASGSSTVANNAYYAPFTAGNIGQWILGTALPEYGVSVAYAPSCQTLFAMGPSGALYSASLPQSGINSAAAVASGLDSGMGTWAQVQTTVPTSVPFQFPAFNLTPDDVPPTIAIYTADGLDYIFILGGVSNGVQLYTGYYTEIDDTGTPSDFLMTPTLPFGTGQGQAAQTAGLYSFSTDAGVYARDTTNLLYLTVYCLATWIDSTGTLNVGTWTPVINQYINPAFVGETAYQLILGIAFDNIITNTSIIALTPDGFGYSDNINSLPTFYAGVLAYDALTCATVYENDDGTASILSSYGYAAWLFPATWIDIPVPAITTDAFIVIEVAGAPRTNFGVNIGIQDNRMYVADADKAPTLNFQFPQLLEFTDLGWVPVSSPTNSMLDITLYESGHAAYPSFFGLFEDSGARWSTVKYSPPNDVLIYMADVTYDVSDVNNTVSVEAFKYDGLGGLNNQPFAILSSTVELV